MDRIRELVESLDARGYESPYLERLRRVARGRRSRAEGGLDALRAEILAEMAASLGRAEDHVNRALLACELLDREIAALDGSDPALLAQKIDEFNRERAQAERRLWELVVQREAIGWRRHDGLDELYPIPKKKRAP